MIRPLYKAQAPFMEVKRGHGFQGVVMWDDQEDKVQCHICGKWFNSLGRHILFTHKQTLEDYKFGYGLSLSTPLCNKNVSEKHSKAATALYTDKKRSALYRANKGRKIVNKRKPARANKMFKPSSSVQFKNSRGLCDLQVRSRYEVVKKIVGHEPRMADYAIYDKKLMGTMIARHGSINNFRKFIGGKPMTATDYQTLPDLDLVAALRQKAKELNRQPTTLDFGKGSKPHLATFYRHFGSWHSALKMAGLR